MSIPFYVNPETLVREKAEFARKNVARGRAVIAIEGEFGIVMVSENPSTHLRKIGEIYDRIAYAGVGRYNEFESLRIAGVRLADMRGYAYHREDVNARAIANAYSQTLYSVFTTELKPMEIEILVAQVGETPADPNEMYQIRFDGIMTDEHGLTVLPADAEEVLERAKAGYSEGQGLGDAVRGAVGALGNGELELGPNQLEVALLSATGGRRRFRRISGDELANLVTV